MQFCNKICKSSCKTHRCPSALHPHFQVPFNRELTSFWTSLSSKYIINVQITSVENLFVTSRIMAKTDFSHSLELNEKGFHWKLSTQNHEWNSFQIHWWFESVFFKSIKRTTGLSARNYNRREEIFHAYKICWEIILPVTARSSIIPYMITKGSQIHDLVLWWISMKIIWKWLAIFL